jgi:hypothetical protein
MNYFFTSKYVMLKKPSIQFITEANEVEDLLLHDAVEEHSLLNA